MQNFHNEASLRRGERASWGRPASQPRVRLTPYTNPAGTMLGFVSAELPSGLIVNNLRLMVGPQGRRWLAMPSQKQVDRDGNPRLDTNGKPLWSDHIEFRDKRTRDRFQDAVLAVLRREQPETFAGEPEG